MSHGHDHGHGSPRIHGTGVDLSALFPAKRKEGEPASEAGDGLRYTCSCHPEIITTKPGDCPLCGMTLVPLGPAGDDPGDRDLKRRLLWGSLLGLGVVVPAMAPMVSPRFAFFMATPWAWVQASLSTAVVFWAGWPLLRRFAKSLQARAWNMFTLTGVGTLIAWSFSVFALLFPAWIPRAFAHHGVPLYFESATVITLLVLLGQVIEGHARRKSNDGLKALWEALPEWAVVQRQGDLVRLPAHAVRRGDTVVVAPGETIPVDGTVRLGTSQVVLSVLTGEAFPVEVKIGSAVRAGGRNLSGPLHITAEAAGKDCLLGKVAAEVTRARQTRTPLVSLADKASKVFIPVVFLVALSAAALWAFLGPEPKWLHALMTALSVLLVACPCALGLAIPMAVAGAVARGARSGILVRDAAVLSALGETDTIVFDKTGTLTRGEPRVTSFQVWGQEMADRDLLSLVASAEAMSRHPLAKAVVAHAESLGIKHSPVTRYQEHPGGGVSARVSGHDVWVGQAPFLKDQGVGGWESRFSHPALSPRQGLSLVAVDGKLSGALVFEDELKDGVRDLLRRLKGRGFRLMLLSGDRTAAVQALAQDLPFEDVRGDVSPLEKAEVVKALSKEGRRVLFAGDGLNDLAALEAAHASVAMGLAASLKSAGILLPTGDLQALERALSLSRALRQNSVVNLALAFGYNLLALPLAAGALVPVTGWVLTPMVAAALMALSSLSVVLSALTLLRVRLDR